MAKTNENPPEWANHMYDILKSDVNSAIDLIKDCYFILEDLRRNNAQYSDTNEILEAVENLEIEQDLGCILVDKDGNKYQF
jgi:hypothetical protein